MNYLTLCSFITFSFISSVFSDDPKVTIIQTDPIINAVEEKVVQYKDKDVQFTCIVENKPIDSEVQWVVLPNNSSGVVQISTATRSHDAFRWSIDNPSSTAWRLRISNSQVTDEGVYTCKVQVQSQNYVEDYVELKIVQRPQISDLITSSDMTKKAKDEATFDCHASGRPQPIVKWSRLAGELMPNGGTEYQGNQFKIETVEADHAGVYKCTAQNSAGKVERKVRLTVNFPPIVTAGSGLEKQAVGYVKELVCNVKGYPQPDPRDITWTGPKQRPIKNEGRFQIRNIPGAYNRITSILVINGVQQEDFDQYRCSARNGIGSHYAVIELRSVDIPTPTRNGKVRSAASALSFSLASILMLISVCLLHQRH